MAITTSEARRKLARLIARVNLDRTSIEITSKRGTAVLMSKDEYDALMETNYLLSSPANAHRLLSALKSIQEKETFEPERRMDGPAGRSSTAPRLRTPTTT